MSHEHSSIKTAGGLGGRWARWQVPAVCVLLATMTFAVFGRTLGQGFMFFDDNEYVFDNTMVVHGLTLAGIASAFTAAHARNWHPLTWISHMLDCQLYGLDAGGHHFTNVLLHAAAVVVLCLALRRMTGNLWRSAVVAAIFAIHPLRVESVAWIAERKDVLSGFFFALTLGAYASYVSGKSAARYGLVVLFFALGLLCKPMLVTLPLILLLLDYWPLRRTETTGRLILEKIPLLALSLASCIATIWAQGNAVQSAESFPVSSRLANALVSCAIYLRQMVYPAGLAVFYPYPRHGPSIWEVVLSGILWAGLLAGGLRQRRKQPWLLVGLLWYLTMLLPVIGIIQVSVQAHADRYTYLPQIGICLAVTWLVAQSGLSRTALGILSAGVLAVLAACACKQVTYWDDSDKLWSHTLACTDDNYLAHFNLGVYLVEKGRVDEAITHFKEALKLNPGDAMTHYNLGIAYGKKGMLNEAAAEYQTTVQLKPDDAEAWNNLGTLRFQQGSFDQAIPDFQKAVELKPSYSMAHYNLAIALQKKGRTNEAATHFEKAQQLDSGDAR